MKVAVCGKNNSELLNRVAKHYDVEFVKAVDNIYESAKVTYEYDDANNVVYYGCVLDYADSEKNMHPFDEQVILCALDNLDIVYVYTPYMTAEEISRYHQFDEFFKGHVVDVLDVNTFEIE